MKRKGFTLVELLAVIIILAVISIITIPLIGNVIKDSRKKALEQSVYGLVEAANYYAIYNDEAHVVFGSEAIKDPKEILDYTGNIEAEGDLYIDKDGDISLCLMNEKYYVYKNYNSGIIIGDRSKGNCVAKHDPLTNKYIAYLEGEVEGSNVYSKEEITELLNDYAKKSDLEAVNTSLNALIDENKNKITTLSESVSGNTNDITTIKGEITDIQTSLSTYATKTELERTNSTIETMSTKLSSSISKNTANITDLQNSISDINSNLNEINIGNISTIKNISMNSTATIKKVNHSIELSFAADANEELPSWTAFASIPLEYAPSQNKYFSGSLGGKNSIQIILTYNGEIMAGDKITSGTGIYFNASYFK